jgi:tetratricopeptide (TPR) repeat protein
MDDLDPTPHAQRTSRPSDGAPRPRHERHEGLHVLRLEGTDYEMGYQHGSLLRAAVERGPIPYFARYVERLFRGGGLGALAQPLSRALGLGLGHTVGRAIAARFPRHVLDALEGLADGAGIARGELLRAVTMPETYLWVVAQLKKVAPAPVAPRFGVPIFGCTSAIAWGGATTSGRMLHGRNFDYQGVGAWDREQAVVFHAPLGAQRYVSIAAAGVLLGGITAMNESGLSLVVHQHVAATDFDLGGLPIGVAGDLVMRHARTLDDARRILDAHRPSGAWTYVIASAKEQAVLCYEVTSRRRSSFRPEGDVFAYSNVFLDARLEGTEVYFYPTYWRNNTGRWRAARALLERHRGRIDEARLASFLGHSGDERDRFRDAIALLTTVASVVFDAGRGVVWVASGAPPVSHERYVAFDLATEAPRPDLAPIDARSAVDPAAHAAFDAYRAAHQAAFDDGDAPAARAALERARSLAPAQPVYHFVAGLLALAADDLAPARDALDRAIALGHPDPARACGFHLWRARVHDRRGDRAAALRDYREAIVGDPAVRAAAERGLRAPWQGRHVSVEWNFGDVVSP